MVDSFLRLWEEDFSYWGDYILSLKNTRMQEFTDESFMIVYYTKIRPLIIPYRKIQWVAPISKDLLINERNLQKFDERILECPLLIKTDQEELYVDGVALMKKRGYIPLLKGFSLKKVKILDPREILKWDKKSITAYF